MKKLIILISILLLISGCQRNEDDDRLLVMTSIYPIYDLTSSISNEVLNVRNIAPLSMEVHDFEPTAQDLVSLEQADLLIVHGNHLEGWLDSTLQTINNKDLKVLVLSEDVPLLNGDVHTWLSLDLMMQYSDMITDAFIEIDPAHQAEFERENEKWLTDANALKQKYQALYDNEVNQDLVVDHAAYAYLANDLNLNQVSITGGQLATDISAHGLKEIIDKIKLEAITTIFKNEESNANLFNVIKSETGVEVEMLYTLEVMSKDNYKPYLEMMDKNLAAIEKVMTHDKN